MTEALHSPDIFELLDIETREDTYSRLLMHLLKHSEGLRRRFLAYGFGDDPPPAERATITLRHGLGDAGVVDVLLRGPEDAATRWVMFIESKLFSAEHGQQTARYWNARGSWALMAALRGSSSPSPATGRSTYPSGRSSTAS